MTDPQGKPDMSRVKKRLEAQVPLAPDAGTPEVKPRIRPETHDMVSKFEADSARMAAEADVKLDTKDGAVDPNAPVDDMYYRGTHYDNAKTRAYIEGLCGEMDFADLIISGRVTQQVPVLPEKFTATFQSLTNHEIYWLAENTPQKPVGQMTPSMWQGFARLVLMTKALGAHDLPSHLDDKGHVSKELFEAKFERLGTLGDKIVDRMLTNVNWFDDRVEQLMDEDLPLLKNG